MFRQLQQRPPQRPPPLRIGIAHGQDAHILRVEGELDLAGCATLEKALVESEESSAELILIDIDGLAFMGVSGLRVILESQRRQAHDQGRLQMTLGRGQVARLFRLTGTDGLLPFNNRVGKPRPPLHLTEGEPVPESLLHAFANDL